MGKSASKPKRPRRSQSMAWSFRFANLNKAKMSPVVILPQHPHLDIGSWLNMLDLPQYTESFSKFIGVEELMYFCEADIKQLGVRNSAHRARIVSSLVALRDKHERGSTKALQNSTNSRSDSFRKSQRYSMPAAKVRETLKHEPFYELLTAADTKQKQSKSLGDLLGMEQSGETIAANGGSSPGTPTQETLALKKALEWELSLDSRDMRSHAWYYSTIPRQRAEEILDKDGDFLVRDCVSQPGNFVLTCRSNGSILHFVINKVVIQRETVYERVQYQFEDDAYDTLPDLITYYVGSGKTISAASGAKIQFPCNRTYPLSFYAAKYGNQLNQQCANSRGVSPLNSPSLANVGFRYTPYSQQQLGNCNAYRSPMSSPPRTKRDIPPRLPSKKQRSQSLTPLHAGNPMVASSLSRVSLAQDKYCSADGVIQDGTNAIACNRLTEAKRLLSMEKCNSADGVIQTVQSRSTNGSTHLQSSGEIKLATTENALRLSLMSRSTGGEQLINNRYNTQSLPRINSGNGHQHRFLSRTSSLTRDGSVDGFPSRRTTDKQFAEEDEATTPTDSPPSPPPKPIRSMVNLRQFVVKDLPLEIGPLNRIASYHASGSDSGNGSGDSAQSSAANDPSMEFVQQHRPGGVIIKNPRFMSSSASQTTLKSFADFDYHEAEEQLLALNILPLKQCSKYDLENFQTLLLPAIENKPLDNGALNTFRMMLSETGPRVLANHMTRIDIKLILGDFIEPFVDEHEYGCDNGHNGDNGDGIDTALECTGIELLTMCHGEQFRKDLIERTECIRLLVAVTILTCSNDDERAETLNKWIQVAIDTKTALGNLFGFCSIMLGLCMPQIQKLESTWHILRQKYTDSAFNFEAKLRPTLKCMNDCSNPQAPNTTVPHLLPYILLKDRSIENFLDMNQTTTSTLVTTCLTPWEVNSSDFGLTIMFSHLDSVRNFSKNLSLYHRNAQIVLSDSTSRYDELLEDSFRTEFHIKFLWGSKGALAAAEDRHMKLEQVLTLMADKFCNYGNGDQAG